MWLMGLPWLVEICIVLLADLCFVFLFFKTTKLREGPGQLILAQTQVQAIVDVHWLLLLIFSSESDSACIVKVVGYFGIIVSCIYASAICVAVSLHYSEQSYPALWLYHAVTLVLSICFFCPILLFREHGKTTTTTFRICSKFFETSWTE